MKTTALLLLLISSTSLFCQKKGYYYSDGEEIKIPSQGLDYNHNCKTFIAIGLATAPTIYFASKVPDLAGKVFYGSIASISVATLLAGSYCYFKSDYSKKPFISYSCAFLAGASEGFNEELNNHYWKVKANFPNMNDHFWNPDISWKNKYDSNIPLAKTIGVMFTDGHHLTNWLRNGFTLGFAFTIEKPKGLWPVVKKIGGSVLSYSAGKGLVHFLINK
jgi:hypothetical protein